MLAIKPASKELFIPFMPELEKEIGERAARLLLHLDFWIRTSNTEEIEGKRWTYQSTKEISEKAFPEWSLSTINRTIHKLEMLELIHVGRFNKARYDKTRWFALNQAGLARLKSIILGDDEPRSNHSDAGSSQGEPRSSHHDARSNHSDATIPETPTENSSETPTENPPAAKRGNAAADFSNPSTPEKVLGGNPIPPAKTGDAQESPTQPAKPITPPIPAHPPIDWLAEECPEDPPDDLKQFFSAAKAGELEAMVKRHGVDHIRAMIESVRLLPNIDNPPGLVVSKLRMEALTTWQWPKKMTDDGKKYITGKYAHFIEH